MKDSPVPARRMIWLVLGHIVWAAGFVALYAMLSIGCEYGWHMVELGGGLSVQRAMLVALFLATLAATLLVTLVTWRRWSVTRERKRKVKPARFLEWAAFVSSLTAFGAAIVSLGPAFALTTCY
jgi:magnesium-transporting ATPase (P-type)